jgi:HEAT repeat protein
MTTMRLRLVPVLACSLCFCALVSAQNEDAFNAKQRISRIRDLGKKGPSAIPALAQYLSDADREIRVEAVKAIVKIDTEASLTPLVKATHDNDSEVQIRATDGLTNFYLPGYVVKAGLTASVTRGVRQVKSYFSSRNDQAVDPDVKIRADVADALAAEIRGGHGMDARANAARAAGILRARPAIPALTEVLRAQDSQLIFESLVALQKIHDPAAGPSVASAAHDLDERIQATALETIGVLRCLKCASDARAALKNARNTKIRRAALEALAMLAIPDDRPTFQNYAKDQDPELQASALEGLGRLREPEDYPVIEQAYNEKDADWRVHLAAAFALVDQGKVDTSEFSPLQYLIENLDMSSHAGVASAYLIELARREDVRRALFPLVSQATKDQKVALCSIFATTHSDDVVPVLNGLLKDIDPDVASAASRALRIAQSGRSS